MKNDVITCIYLPRSLGAKYSHIGIISYILLCTVHVYITMKLYIKLRTSSGRGIVMKGYMQKFEQCPSIQILLGEAGWISDTTECPVTFKTPFPRQ